MINNDTINSETSIEVQKQNIADLEFNELLVENVTSGKILNQLLEQITPINFKQLVYLEQTGISEKKKVDELIPKLEKHIENITLTKTHYLILSIENILKVAKKHNWALCKNNNYLYIYNGEFWSEVDKMQFINFLANATRKMGVPKFTVKHYEFSEKLFKQFISDAYLPTPEISKNVVKINLLNGTFQIDGENMGLKAFEQNDFITYQLPFMFDPLAKAPSFRTYLDKVLPNSDLQNILSEFLGYIFIKNGNKLKLEKTLMLYGTGANGKSVFFEIVYALLGKENVSSFSLQKLTDNTGYTRAKIANKLLNYASEINGILDMGIFKQMISGETIEARLPYGEPFTLTQYPKFIFNCNELPKEVENTDAFFRRFLIIPFKVTIPEEEQDKELANKIINNELSGVFNWVLDGLNRLLKQKKFTYSQVVTDIVKEYEIHSDSIRLFIEDRGYKKSSKEFTLVSKIYPEYRTFCNDDGLKPINKVSFIKRIETLGVLKEKKNVGNVFYLTKTPTN